MQPIKQTKDEKGNFVLTRESLKQLSETRRTHLAAKNNNKISDRSRREEILALQKQPKQACCNKRAK